jgi:hypothetical protein
MPRVEIASLCPSSDCRSARNGRGHNAAVITLGVDPSQALLPVSLQDDVLLGMPASRRSDAWTERAFARIDA